MQPLPHWMVDNSMVAQVYDGNMRLSIEAFMHWGVSTLAAVLVDFTSILCSSVDLPLPLCHPHHGT